MQKVLVSACLLGAEVRYNGKCRLDGHAILRRWQEEGRIVALCPEIEVGFSVPRPPAEISIGASGTDVLAGIGRVHEDDGTDVTRRYVAAAEMALSLVREHSIRFAVLTDGSPSCGSTFIYDGLFSGKTRVGQGTTAALLAANGVNVYAEDAIPSLDAVLQNSPG